MNDILTQRIEVTALSGDVAPDLRTAFGPQGDEFRLNVPEGFAARLWSFSVYPTQLGTNSRLGIALMRSPVPADGVRAWTNDNEVLDDGNQLASYLHSHLIVTTGATIVQGPVEFLLWDLDYRLVLNPRVAGFAQTAQQCGFRLRYKLIKVSRADVAAILFWQNQGVKVE